MLRKTIYSLMQDGIVNLIDLPQNETYINVSLNFKNKIYKLAIKKFGSLYKLSKILNEPANTLYSFLLEKDKCPLRTFLKLIDHFQIKNYLSEIRWIGGKKLTSGIKNPKIPFNFNTEAGGTFIAAVLGDGMIFQSFEVGYKNSSPLMLKIVKKASNKLFGRVKVRETKDFIIFPSIIGRILKLFGMKPGRKTVSDPHIPTFILNGNEKCKIGFLKQISDDEGSPQIKPPYSYSIRYEFAVEIPEEEFRNRNKYVPNLLKDLHKLVRDLGFSTTNIYGGRIYKGRKKPRYCISFAFDIQGRQSLEKFAKEINFRIPKRREKLKMGLRRMQRYTYGRKGEFVALKTFFDVLLEKGSVNKHEFSKLLNRSLRDAEEWLRKLRKKGLIKIIGGNEFIGSGFCSLKGRSPFVYTITPLGYRVLRNQIEEKELIKVLPKYQNSDIYYKPRFAS